VSENCITNSVLFSSTIACLNKQHPSIKKSNSDWLILPNLLRDFFVSSSYQDRQMPELNQRSLQLANYLPVFTLTVIKA